MVGFYGKLVGRRDFFHRVLRAAVNVDAAGRIVRAERLLRRLEPPHGAFTLTGRLVGVLRSVVQPLVPPMLCTGKDSSKSWRITRELIGDHHPWLGPGSRQNTP